MNNEQIKREIKVALIKAGMIVYNIRIKIDRKTGEAVVSNLGFDYMSISSIIAKANIEGKVNWLPNGKVVWIIQLKNIEG